MYGLDTLHKYGKKVGTKNQKDLRASSYACKSYKGNAERGLHFNHLPPPSPPPILNMVNTGKIACYYCSIKNLINKYIGVKYLRIATCKTSVLYA